MTLQRTTRSTLAGQVAAQIEQMIESGQWKVGEKIPTGPELMDMFDVSRNTVREGIRSLVHAGLLEARQGIGTIVRSDSDPAIALEKKVWKSDLLETSEVRLGLEREAAQLAAGRRTAEELRQMENISMSVKRPLRARTRSSSFKRTLLFINPWSKPRTTRCSLSCTGRSPMLCRGLSMRS